MAGEFFRTVMAEAKVSIVVCSRSYPSIFLFLLILTALIETIQMLNEWSIQSGRNSINILLGQVVSLRSRRAWKLSKD